MSKRTFKIDYINQLEIQKYISLYNHCQGDMSRYRDLESRCVKSISDTMVFVRWNQEGHMMGWKRISEETKIPVDVIKHFRDTPEYYESLKERLLDIGVDMIDGIAMKKKEITVFYLQSKFGMSIDKVADILLEIEPRDLRYLNPFFNSKIQSWEKNKLIYVTQEYLKHEIPLKESKEISKQAITFLIKKRYAYDLKLAAKAAGMIFALKGHKPCGKCLVPIYSGKTGRNAVW